ncbi:MAG TPA: DUF2341 domain-containing protein [Kofleriaceae bacterium]|jgi:hypothetical protein
MVGRLREVILASVLLAGCGFKAGGAGTPSDDQPPGDANGDSDGPQDGPLLPDTPEANAVCLEGNDFCLRKRITIPPSKVHGNAVLQNFPLLVVLLNDADLSAHTRSDGHDIEFTAADGTTVIPYDRQNYDQTSGSLVAWVRVPRLSNTDPTDIYMYYEKSSATDRQDAAATWDSTYHGVWHLDADANDVSGDNNDGAGTGVAFAQAGHIGASAKYEQMGDRIKINNSSTLDAVTSAGTFSMWVNFVQSAATRYQILVSNTESFKTSNSDGFSWALRGDGDMYFYPWVDDPSASSDYAITAAPPFTASVWHLATVTYDQAIKKVIMYCDGQPLATMFDGTTTDWTQAASVSDWYVGQNPDNAGSYFIGSIDEMRISSVARSPGWIQTEYDNQLAPSTFYAVGPQTQLQPN